MTLAVHRDAAMRRHPRGPTRPGRVTLTRIICPAAWSAALALAGGTQRGCASWTGRR
jgi:hypothetical protein